MASPSLLPLCFLGFFVLAATNAAATSGRHQLTHLGEEKTTHLRFYAHETFSGPNATTAGVVAAKLPSGFGSIGVIDDVLREGPDPSSKLIGRVQGVTAGSSLDGNGLLTIFNVVFTEGEYNGSTLAMLGRGVIGTVMDRPIVGGSGKFRLARGYSLAQRTSLSATGVVLEFDFYVTHY